jgi:pantoate kinase
VSDTGEVRARAFAPGHVTGWFAPALDVRDPRGRGSVGAGIVLGLGVFADARFRPGGPTRVRVTSDLAQPLPISAEVARRLAAGRPGTLSVRLAHQLPVGQGFGTSAAGATATALAVARALGRPRRRAQEVAHLADLFGEGGLGGVAAILDGGGIETRRRPGIPPWGETIHRAWREPVLIGIVGGPLPSPEILRSPVWRRRIERAAPPTLRRLGSEDAEGFFAASEAFTDRLGLASPGLLRVIRGLRRRGVACAQAMFGRAFFARSPDGPRRDSAIRWLLEARVRAVEVRPARQGASLVPAEPRLSPFT